MKGSIKNRIAAALLSAASFGGHNYKAAAVDHVDSRKLKNNKQSTSFPLWAKIGIPLEAIGTLAYIFKRERDLSDVRKQLNDLEFDRLDKENKLKMAENKNKNLKANLEQSKEKRNNAERKFSNLNIINEFSKFNSKCQSNYFELYECCNTVDQKQVVKNFKNFVNNFMNDLVLDYELKNNADSNFELKKNEDMIADSIIKCMLRNCLKSDPSNVADNEKYKEPLEECLCRVFYTPRGVNVTNDSLMILDVEQQSEEILKLDTQTKKLEVVYKYKPTSSDGVKLQPETVWKIEAVFDVSKWIK